MGYIQLALPLMWWGDPERPDMWRNGGADTVNRETEELALANIGIQYRLAQRGDLAISELEWRAYQLELLALRTKPHYGSDWARAQWIAGQMHRENMTPRQVMALLDHVSLVIAVHGRPVRARERKEKLAA